MLRAWVLFYCRACVARRRVVEGSDERVYLVARRPQAEGVARAALEAHARAARGERDCAAGRRDAAGRREDARGGVGPKAPGSSVASARAVRSVIAAAPLPLS